MSEITCTLFVGESLVSTGPVDQVVLAAKRAFDHDPHASILMFDERDGRRIEYDLNASVEALARLTAPQPATKSPGRPKLGVVAREVTLLPRHWDWLSSQSGGASVTLRKLVEAASRADDAPMRKRAAQDAAYRFISVMAGDRQGFEEASRALFAGDRAGFEKQSASWPSDIRDHALKLAAESWA